MKPTGAEDLPPIRIEAEAECAWCGQQRLQLMPKAFALLRYLVDHPGRLITKEELVRSVWHDAIVSDAALSTCIRDLRKALGDSPDTPRYIETVHRRGYRFIGPIARSTAPRIARTSGGRHSSPSPALVGRNAELARLHESLKKAMDRQRQLVFVTGEAGIGKTALVEAFLAELDGTDLRVGRGQCVEHYGAGEAYLPVMEALGRLGRAPRGGPLIRVLMQHAPTWLAQLPALLTDEDLESVRRRAQGATRERMLRELAEGLDALTVDSPLVLVLEDLHWSDSATIDLLSMLARRRDASRLLVLATYRPVEVAISEHPLKAATRELELHGRCDEIPLEFLSVEAVAAYLSGRLGPQPWLSGLAAALHRRTDGNPLFLVNMTDELIGRGRLRKLDTQWTLSVPVQDLAGEAPETLWQMVEKQIERLTPNEQAVLAVASVAGVEFSAAVATADRIDVEDGERHCEALARRGQFLRTTGVAEWPDGTIAGRFAFIHALYQQVLYARTPTGHRVDLHLRTGERLERAYGQHAGEIAGELARHFAEGRDVARAARYHHQAAEGALRQHGYREAADHVTRALELLNAVPASQERTQQELALHVMLGSAMTALKGHAGPEVEQAYARARELCEQVDDPSRLVPVLVVLGWFYFVRGAQDAARDVGTRLLTMAEATRDPAIFLAAHHALGVAAFYGGEFESAVAHFEQGIALYDPEIHSSTRSAVFRFNVDSGGSCLLHGAWALWVLGYPTRASSWMRQALDLAQSIEHPFSLAHGYRFAAAFHQSRREWDASSEQAERGVALSTGHGFGAALMAANFHRGWALARQGREEEGLALMRAWVAACRAIRSECLLPGYLAWLAEMYGEIGQPREGLTLVDEALATAARSGNNYWTADLHRLRGALVGADAEAESSFLEAIAIARQQGAKSFELRAATSLTRLWVRNGKVREARALLAETYAWFTEGFDTPDLRDARTLLDEIERTMARPSTVPGATQKSPE